MKLRRSQIFEPSSSINLLPSYIDVNLSICFIFNLWDLDLWRVCVWLLNTIYYTILLVSRSSVGVLRFKVVFDSLFSSCCSMTLYTAPNIASIRQFTTTLSHKFKVHASKSVLVWNVHVWYADLLKKTLFYLIKLCSLCFGAFKAFLGLHELVQTLQ